MTDISDYIYPITAEHIGPKTAFTYPFQYTPHPLVYKASGEVIKHLKRVFTDPKFAQKVNQKMYGILIVSDSKGHIGYLIAISGINPDISDQLRIVPSIVSLETKDGFFREEEKYITRLNHLISEIENNSFYKSKTDEYDKVTEQNTIFLREAKIAKQIAKQKRDALRASYSQMQYEEQIAIDKLLNYESQQVKKEYKVEKNARKAHEESLYVDINKYNTLLNDLKSIRKKMSQTLQRRIFKQYDLFNGLGNKIDLVDLFQQSKGVNPPAGAGDCAAPKLLQFAYQNNLKPVFMGEFWWDPENQDELKKHMHFYPSCKNKCQPILTYMLQGIEVEPNPITITANKHYELEMLYEDEYIMAVNKPSGLLSVPGKEIQNSVYQVIHDKHPEFEGPLLVHRLDMSTSGILIVTKDLETYKRIQKQFLQKKIHKKYIALVKGNIPSDHGVISLPLRVDLDNRPLQMICEKYGKEAITNWEKISSSDGVTKLSLYPITGRTHQLRVHCAHSKGLNSPIIGDDLYGKANKTRLCLHAEQITFEHPYTQNIITISCIPPF
ncbi:RluA family pseudouridine synthase [Prolixibacteraceae bacterium]|nr:RluA family pseudouridine synthase [Prolixibacteraceae bacterium]